MATPGKVELNHVLLEVRDPEISAESEPGEEMLWLSGQNHLER
jgi:hypothetical protein